MANYDLYKELHLDEDMPPNGIADILGDRLSELRSQGYSSDSPEVDQLETARAILGDPYKRDIYEAALYGAQDDVVNIRWLHDLADSQSPSPAAEYDYPPSAAPTRAHAVDPVGGGSSDLEDTRVTQAVPDEPAVEEQPEADSGISAEPEPEPLPEPDPEPLREPLPEPSGQYRPSEPSQFADTGAGVDAGRPAAAATNSWQQPDGQPGYAQGGNENKRPASQLDTSNWGVGNRRRSESKIYLGILAVIAVGMIYPLIVLLTTGPDDINAVLSVMKASLFTLAHVAAWMSVNEIIWGVRKIVAPGNPVEK